MKLDAKYIANIHIVSSINNLLNGRDNHILWYDKFIVSVQFILRQSRMNQYVAGTSNGLELTLSVQYLSNRKEV
jgi:hypothetical protein